MTRGDFISFRLRQVLAAAIFLAFTLNGTALGTVQEVRTKELPLVWVLSTGGTIAGRGASSTSLTEYKSGSILGEELVRAVPEIKQFADVKVEQIINVGSPDLTLDNWIALANRINGIFSQDPNVSGIVVTHGTSTLEETAYLNVRKNKRRESVGGGLSMSQCCLLCQPGAVGGSGGSRAGGGFKTERRAVPPENRPVP